MSYRSISFWFDSMEEARARIEAWRIDYNESRPHQALQEETLAQFAMRAKGSSSVSLSTAEKKRGSGPGNPSGSMAGGSQVMADLGGSYHEQTF
jgi:hypothetical protein